jgi:hypothetical protein
MSLFSLSCHRHGHRPQCDKDGNLSVIGKGEPEIYIRCCTPYFLVKSGVAAKIKMFYNGNLLPKLFIQILLAASCFQPRHNTEKTLIHFVFWFNL